MTITTINDVVAGLGAQNNNYWAMKKFSAGLAAGAFQSSFYAAGNPGACAVPPAYTAGSGYACDKTTTGAMTYNNAVTQNWLAKWFATSTVAGTLILCDRLWACSGMGFAATTYSVTTPGSLPARITDSGVGVQIWIEQYVAAGANTGTITANYLNPSAGAESGVLSTILSAPVIGQMQQIPLQVGSVGVSQLTSIVNSQTWTSGSWGITLLKPIAAIPLLASGTGYTLDWASVGLPQIPANACLMWIFQTTAATANTVISQTQIIDK
jgi:hypothetical protein